MKNQTTAKASKTAKKEPKALSALPKTTPKAKKKVVAIEQSPAQAILKPRAKAAKAVAIPAVAPVVPEMAQRAALETTIVAAPIPAKLSDILAPADLAASGTEAPVAPVVRMVTKEIRAEQPSFAQAKEEERSKSTFQYSAPAKKGILKKWFQKVVDLLGK